jgi:NAD(P)-dependent dehydrogenase (short-subunit alcohol dehydrogenase family)
VQGIVKSAALDNGARRIRINALLPGTTGTPLVRPPGFCDDDWRRFKRAWGEVSVDGLHRMAEPHELAAAALALASGEFSDMTGASIFVDGGAPVGAHAILPNAR